MVAQTQVMYWGGHYQEGLKKHWSNFDLFYTNGLFLFCCYLWYMMSVIMWWLLGFKVGTLKNIQMRFYASANRKLFYCYIELTINVA